ncbi:MAG: FHA domain-containing protein [Dermatophilaceae bacterium]
MQRQDQPASAVLPVTYTGEPDVVHELGVDGQSLRFGREDTCDIVIWSAINSTRLSSVAGVIWRMDDELWLRNLSTAHDLYVVAPGFPPEPPLPPRLTPTARGAARSLPFDLAYVRGPDGCDLRVRQLTVDTEGITLDALATGTNRIPPVPPDLVPTAAALCEPLFLGSQLPASYAHIGIRTGNHSRRSVRNQVERLTVLYLDEVPSLRDHLQRRLEREAAQLSLTATPRVHNGITRFDVAQPDMVDAAEVERRSALALPTYFEVAHLLVRRRLVSAEDLALLTTQGEYSRGLSGDT